MLCIRDMEACDNPMIPERQQCLLRLKMIHLLRGFGGSADNPWQVDRPETGANARYNPEIEGYLVYIQKEDQDCLLPDLGFELPLSGLLLQSVTFCEYSQCFDAILVLDQGFTYHFIIPLEHIGSLTLLALQSYISLQSHGHLLDNAKVNGGREAAIKAITTGIAKDFAYV